MAELKRGKSAKSQCSGLEQTVRSIGILSLQSTKGEDQEVGRLKRDSALGENSGINPRQLKRKKKGGHVGREKNKRDRGEGKSRGGESGENQVNSVRTETME